MNENNAREQKSGGRQPILHYPLAGSGAIAPAAPTSYKQRPMSRKTAAPRPAATGTDAQADLTSPAPAGAAGYDWQDPLALEGERTEDDRMVQATARG